MMLAALRHATRGVHERLHHHALLKSLREGSLSLADYVLLLQRMRRFYASAAPALDIAARRMALIDSDLASLRVTAGQRGMDTVRLGLGTPARRLGAEYVIEGSALGGVVLAQGAARLLGGDPRSGYRFFAGDGAATGARWRAFTRRLDEAAAAGFDTEAVVAGAVHTFEAFETIVSPDAHSSVY